MGVIPSSDAWQGLDGSDLAEPFLEPWLREGDEVSSFKEPGFFKGLLHGAGQGVTDIVLLPATIAKAGVHVGQDVARGYGAVKQGAERVQKYYNGLSWLPRTAIKATIGWYKSPYTILKKGHYILGATLIAHPVTDGLSTKIAGEAAVLYLKAYANSLRVVPPVGRFALYCLTQLEPARAAVFEEATTVPGRAGANEETAEAVIDAAKTTRHPVRTGILSEAEKRAQEERAQLEARTRAAEEEARRLREEEAAGFRAVAEAQRQRAALEIQARMRAEQEAARQRVVAHNAHVREVAIEAGIYFYQRPKLQAIWSMQGPVAFHAARCRIVIANANTPGTKKEDRLGLQDCGIIRGLDL